MSKNSKGITKESVSQLQKKGVLNDLAASFLERIIDYVKDSNIKSAQPPKITIEKKSEKIETRTDQSWQ